jgi:D-glycero-D-manno-heptose 1,7-bisphosphate phosphatase
MNKNIILDRDGVINFDAPTGIHSPDMWQPIPGSLMAVADLNRAGWQVFVITNQSGIARGYYDLAALSDIHEKMMRELSAVGGYIQEIFFCPHHPGDSCLCRKPRPGLFFQCRDRYGFSLEDVYYVGDKLSDVQAAKAAGCRPILVMTGQGSEALQHSPAVDVDIFPDLAAVAAFLLQQE